MSTICDFIAGLLLSYSNAAEGRKPVYRSRNTGVVASARK